MTVRKHYFSVTHSGIMVHLKKQLSHSTDFSALYADSSEQRLTQCESHRCRSYFSPCGDHIKVTVLTSMLKEELRVKGRVFIRQSIKSHSTGLKVNPLTNKPDLYLILFYISFICVIQLFQTPCREQKHLEEHTDSTVQHS